MKKLIFALIGTLFLVSCSQDESIEAPVQKSVTVGATVKVRIGLKYFEANNKNPGVYMQVENPQAMGDDELIVDLAAVINLDYQTPEDIEIAYSAIHDVDVYGYAPDMRVSRNKPYGEFIFHPEIAKHIINFDMGHFEFKIAEDNYMEWVILNTPYTGNNPVIGQTPNGLKTRFHFYIENAQLYNHNVN